MAAALSVRTTDYIKAKLEEMRQKIEKRAYELSEIRGDSYGNPMDDWLSAEAEFVWAPGVKVDEGDKEVVVTMDLPGLKSKDVVVEVSPRDLLVEARTSSQSTQTQSEITTEEFQSARLFRQVGLAREIDPESAKSQLRGGVLRITAAVAGQASAGAKQQEPEPAKKKVTNIGRRRLAVA